MTEEAHRTGAKPAEPATPNPAFDLPTLLEAQLSEGLSLLRHATEIAGDSGGNYPRDRNGAMSAAARLMLANARLAETLSRLNGDNEKVVRQIVEVKRAQDRPPSGRPSWDEHTWRRAAEQARIREGGRPEDSNTAWLNWYWSQDPLWAAQEEGEGVAA
jgi:hypothetical protein